MSTTNTHRMIMTAPDGEPFEYEVRTDMATARTAHGIEVDCWIVLRRLGSLEQVALNHDGTTMFWSDPDRALADIRDGAAWGLGIAAPEPETSPIGETAMSKRPGRPLFPVKAPRVVGLVGALCLAGQQSLPGAVGWCASRLYWIGPMPTP